MNNDYKLEQWHNSKQACCPGMFRGGPEPVCISRPASRLASTEQCALKRLSMPQQTAVTGTGMKQQLSTYKSKYELHECFDELSSTLPLSSTFDKQWAYNKTTAF